MPALTCGTTTSDAGICIYAPAARSCAICGMPRSFDPADWFAPWPSWDGLKPGDTILLRWNESTPLFSAVVLSTHRSGAQVEVTPPARDDGQAPTPPWIQFVTQKCSDGAYAR